MLTVTLRGLDEETAEDQLISTLTWNENSGEITAEPENESSKSVLSKHIEVHDRNGVETYSAQDSPREFLKNLYKYYKSAYFRASKAEDNEGDVENANPNHGKDGKFSSGPISFKSDRDEDGGRSSHSIHVGGEEVGSIEMGDVGGETRTAKRMFPEQVKANHTAARIHGIEVHSDYRGGGRSLGQLLYLHGLANSGSDWGYNSQASQHAVNALKHLKEKGLIELHWRGGEPDYSSFTGDHDPDFGHGGVHIARITEAGKRVLARAAAPDEETSRKMEAKLAEAGGEVVGYGPNHLDSLKGLSLDQLSDIYKHHLKHGGYFSKLGMRQKRQHQKLGEDVAHQMNRLEGLVDNRFFFSECARDKEGHCLPDGATVGSEHLKKVQSQARQKAAEVPPPTKKQVREAAKKIRELGAAAYHTLILGNVYDRAASRKKLIAEFSTDGGKTCPCVYCGLKLTSDTVTRDKILTAQQGGRYKHSNLVPACLACNMKRGDVPFEEIKWPK